jgi:hypothetical protein
MAYLQQEVNYLKPSYYAGVSLLITPPPLLRSSAPFPLFRMVCYADGKSSLSQEGTWIN